MITEITSILQPSGEDFRVDPIVVISGKTRSFLARAMADRQAADEICDAINLGGKSLTWRTRVIIEEMLCSRRLAREMATLVESGGTATPELKRVLHQAIGSHRYSQELIDAMSAI